MVNSARIKIRRVSMNRNEKTIFRDLAIHKVHTSEEISNELRLSTADVNSSLNNLMDAGLVLPVSSGAGSVIYSPSIEGLKFIRAGGMNADSL